MSDKITRILEEFEKQRVQSGLPSTNLETADLVKLSIQAAYSVGYDDGYAQSKQDVLQKVGEELIKRG